MGLALHNYHDVHLVFPPGSLRGTGLAWGFIAYTFPFIEQASVYSTIDFTQTDCAVFLKAQQMAGKADATSILLPLLNCPTDPRGGTQLLSGPAGPFSNTYDAGKLYPANYVGVSGSRESATWCPYGGIINGDGMFYTSSHVRFADITDGASNTFLPGERGIKTDYGCGWPICGGTECERQIQSRTWLDAG